MHIKKMIFMLLITLSTPGYSILASDAYLLQLITIGYDRLAELQDIAETNVLISEGVEKTMTKINQVTYRIDRQILWFEEMEELFQESPEKYDDYIMLVKRLKSSKKDLISRFSEIVLEKQSIQVEINSSKKQEKMSKKKLITYQKDAKSKMSPNEAAVATANNTQDIKVELASLGKKMSNLTKQLAQIREEQNKEKEEKAKKEILESQKYLKRKKGFLNPKDFKRN